MFCDRTRQFSVVEIITSAFRATTPTNFHMLTDQDTFTCYTSQGTVTRLLGGVERAKTRTYFTYMHVLPMQEMQKAFKMQFDASEPNQ